MIRSIDSNSEVFLTALNRAATRMERAQKQVATSKRVSVPSDAPDAIPTILELRLAAASLEQTTRNLGRAKSETDTAEQTLQSAAKLMDRAASLAAEGGTGTQTADGRVAIASEATSLLEQMVGLSRTTVEGRYIFSGDSDQTPPYSIDWTASPVVSAYGGSAATRQVEHPNGSRMTLSRTAHQIFDGPGAANVFGAIDALRTALLNNDEPGIQAAASAVGSASSYLETQLAFYGSAQNQVDSAIDYASKYKLQIDTQLGSLEDADMADAIIQLQQAQTQQQAALLVQSKMPRASLFDFLG